MSSLERRLAALTNRAANLNHQLRELHKLRDRIRQAELSAQKCGKMRKDAESLRKPAETERNEATLADTPRACLFREAKPALLALGISDMNIRSEIVALIEASLKAHPKETALRHQARALKREAEIICGELLIWMQASGLRIGISVLQIRSPAEASPGLCDFATIAIIALIMTLFSAF